MFFLRVIFPLALLLLTQIACAAPQFRIFDQDGRRFETLRNLSEDLPRQGHVVIGEYHYQADIQFVTAQIILAFAQRSDASQEIVFGWEFLNFHDSKKIQAEWQKVLEKKVSTIDFLKIFFPKQSEQTYLPIFNVLAEKGLPIFGLNLAREHKKIVSEKGIEALEKKWKPKNLTIGGELYFDRFKAVMGGHVGEEQLQNYFEAQCLTDSWMSHELLKKGEGKLSIGLMGSFHSDYGFGTVSRLKKMSSEKVITMKLIPVGNFSPMTLEKYFTPDSKYGHLGDYLIFIKTKVK